MMMSVEQSVGTRTLRRERLSHACSCLETCSALYALTSRFKMLRLPVILKNQWGPGSFPRLEIPNHSISLPFV
jgi:hypothetical protein